MQLTFTCIKKLLHKLFPTHQHLLPKGLRGGRAFHPSSGFCYIASEVIYHLLGGKESGLTVYYGRDIEHDVVTHWWLQRGKRKLDATREQFPAYLPTRIYANAERCGFLTKKISKRGRQLLIAVLALHERIQLRRKKS